MDAAVKLFDRIINKDLLIRRLNLSVNQVVSEDKVIDIVVPTKMSQLTNDSSYITRDDITEDLVEEIKKDIEEELGGEIETTSHKVQVITEEGSEVDYPSTKAVVDYLNSHIISEEEINEIINAHRA